MARTTNALIPSTQSRACNGRNKRSDSGWPGMHRFPHELRQCRFSGFMIERIGRLLILDAVEQALNVTRDRVGGQHQHGVQCVDVFAGHRPFGMAQERGDGDFCEAKVVGNAGEAVTQDVWCDVGKRCAADEFVPMVRKDPKSVVVAMAGEDMGTVGGFTAQLQCLDDWRAGSTCLPCYPSAANSCSQYRPHSIEV
jgi:hypothetical protein